MIPRFHNDRIGLANSVEAARIALLPRLMSLENDLDTLATIQALNAPFPVPPEGMPAFKKRIHNQLHVEKSRLFWREQTATQLGTSLLRRIITGASGCAHKERRSILFVIPYDIVDVRTGGASRLFGLARQLAREFDVNMITLVGARRDAEVIHAYPGVTLYAVPRTIAFEQHVKDLHQQYGDAAALMAMHTGAYKLPLLAYWVETVGHDATVVIIDGPPLLDVVKRALPDKPIIYESPNIYQQFVAMLAGRGTPQASDAERLASELEAEICKESQLVVCVSESDRSFMISAYGVPKEKLLVVPNGISTKECLYVPPIETERIKQYAGVNKPIALFVGALHKPNVEAARFIMRCLAPRLSHIQFVVAGMNSEDITYDDPAVLPSNYTVTGKVSNILKEALMAISDVTLCPVVSGGGSSLKIPDYVAHGKPVISTAFGVRGFDELATLITVAELDSFGDALLNVIGSLGQRKSEMDRQCNRALEIVKSRFDWEISVERLMAQVVRISSETNG